MSKVFVRSPLPSIEQIKTVQEVLSSKSVLLKIEQNFPYEVTKNKDLKNSIAGLDPQAVHDKLTEMYNYSLDTNWSNAPMFDNSNLSIPMANSGFIQRITNREAQNYSPHEIAIFAVLAEADLLSNHIPKMTMNRVEDAINAVAQQHYSDISNCVPLMYMAAQEMGFYKEQELEQDIDSDVGYSSDDEEIDFADRVNAQKKKPCCITM